MEPWEAHHGHTGVPAAPVVASYPEPATTCRGTTKENRRCRISWGLNAFGYCTYHQHQAPKGVCQGVTKRGTLCAISWGLSASGYCKYHEPEVASCRGIAASTGQRCRIRWDLDSHGYCKYHRGAVAPRQCRAVARSTGLRCRITTGIDADGFCSVHKRYSRDGELVPSVQRCQGVVVHSGEPCRNAAKPDYKYCCAAHDPSVSYVSPRLFDAPDKTRAALEDAVVAKYDGHDLYHADKLDLHTPGLVELDHIVEKQCFAYAFQLMALTDGGDERFLAEVLREEYVNDVENVCLTRATTNKVKGAAVWKFLDDSLTGHASDMTFKDYLRKEERDGTRVGRSTSRVIVREMGRALKKCQQKLENEGETKLMESMSGKLQKVFMLMDLKEAKRDPSSRWSSDAKSKGEEGEVKGKEERRKEKKKGNKADKEGEAKTRDEKGKKETSKEKTEKKTEKKEKEKKEGGDEEADVSVDAIKAIEMGEKVKQTETVLGAMEKRATATEVQKEEEKEPLKEPEEIGLLLTGRIEEGETKRAATPENPSESAKSQSALLSASAVPFVPMGGVLHASSEGSDGDRPSRVETRQVLSTTAAPFVSASIELSTKAAQEHQRHRDGGQTSGESLTDVSIQHYDVDC